MKERAISVTEASRNFAECINRVRYQGLSFLLVKNGTAVARLVPASGGAHAVIEGNTATEDPAVLPSEARRVARPAQLSAKSQPAMEMDPNQALDNSLQW